MRNSELRSLALPCDVKASMKRLRAPFSSKWDAVGVATKALPTSDSSMWVLTMPITSCLCFVDGLREEGMLWQVIDFGTTFRTHLQMFPVINLRPSFGTYV